MRLPKFTYLEPRSISEACAQLAEHSGQARLLSGGSDLLVLMKQRLETPQYVVNVGSIPGLSYVEHDAASGLRIGPRTTLRTVAMSPIVREKYPVLAEAARRVASPLIRNSATLGGNIALDTKCIYYNQSHHWRKSFAPCRKRGGDVCHVVKGGQRCFSVHCADTVPALMVLGAKVDLMSPRGTRTLALEAFCTGIGETPNVLAPDEMIAEIHVPVQAPGIGAAFTKLASRASIDFGLVNVAVALTRDADSGLCADARIAVGAIGPGPVWATRAAEQLRGQQITDEALDAAGETAVTAARHISSVWTSVSYRRKMIKVLVARTAQEAWNRTQL